MRNHDILYLGGPIKEVEAGLCPSCFRALRGPVRSGAIVRKARLIRSLSADQALVSAGLVDWNTSRLYELELYRQGAKPFHAFEALCNALGIDGLAASVGDQDKALAGLRSRR